MKPLAFNINLEMFFHSLRHNFPLLKVTNFTSSHFCTCWIKDSFFELREFIKFSENDILPVLGPNYFWFRANLLVFAYILIKAQFEGLTGSCSSIDFQKSEVGHETLS